MRKKRSVYCDYIFSQKLLEKSTGSDELVNWLKMSTGDNAGPAKKQRQFITSLMKGYPFFQEVHDDGKKDFCTICNQELLAVSMEMFQSHVESKTHQKNLNHNDGKDNKCKKFSLKLFQDARFDSWLQEVPQDETKFRCTLCQVERSCACGVGNVVRHAEMSDYVKEWRHLQLKLHFQPKLNILDFDAIGKRFFHTEARMEMNCFHI